MRLGLSVIIWCIVFECTLFGQTANRLDEARALSEQAIVQARAGETAPALKLYERALTLVPEDIAILRDYAVVLGWADKYPEAMAAIKKLKGLQNDQPIWAVREFARTYLYGDATEEAVRTLDQLVERGDDSEQTLVRRALALRWLGHSREAEAAYATALKSYPSSAGGIAGMAYVLADQNKLSDALRTLDSSPVTLHQNPEILQARIRILNFMGRHFEAQRLLETLPVELTSSRDTFENRVAAERWGGQPTDAMMDAVKASTLFPGRATRSLLDELRTEYGASASPAFRFSKDSDGLIDRTASTDMAIHLNPAHAIRIGYQYRWLEQNHVVRSLVRYDLGWTGILSRRFAIYSTASNVDYRTPGVSRKFAGDASVAVAANDVVQLDAGGGRLVMDAFNAIGNRVTARFGFGAASLRFDPNTRLHVRYSRYSFSDNITRDRVDGELSRSVLMKSRARVSIGWRSNLMWHDGQTNDFYSPSHFQSHLAFAGAEGRITSWLDYSGEAATGWQSESNSPTLHPFQATGRLSWHPDRHLRLAAEAAKSTSSLDRVNPGMRVYSRWAASGSIEIRFP